MKNNVRVFMNTGFLYGKMLVTMVITLYTTRIILDALGEKDYGIFQLTAGVIMMLAFINSAMAVATQRYMSFYLGAKDKQKLKSIFNSSVILHLFIGLIIVVLLELVGIYLFDSVLNIPADRFTVAKKVYHFMVISTFFTINAVPYDASINAHENMLFDALTGIFESVMKLVIAFVIINYHSDKLVLYGLLYALLTIVIRVIKSIYCYFKYDECRIRFKEYFDLKLIKEMFSFAGWNLIGSFSNVVRAQGLQIILNAFFTVVMNAAFGISQQINSQLASFSTNMLKALNPQIAKSEGGGDRNRMVYLAKIACKFSFFLLLFFAIPLIIEMDYVLNIWLKEVPEYTVIFCKLALAISMLQMLSQGLISAIQSVGKIKSYMITVGVLYVMNIPLAYILLKAGMPPYSVLIGSFTLELIAGGARMWYAKKITGLNGTDFLKNIVMRSFISVMIILFLSSIPVFLLGPGYLRLIITTLTSTLFIFITAKYIGLTADENEMVKKLFQHLIAKLKGKVLGKQTG